MNKKKLGKRELLDALYRLLDEAGAPTQEERDQSIRTLGYEPEPFADRMEQVARQAMAASPMNWRNRAREELRAERERLEANSTAGEGGREGLLRRLEELLVRIGGQSQPAYAHHRNLETASDEDLRGLIEELEYLLTEEGPTDD